MGAFRQGLPKQQAAIPQAPTGKRTGKRGEADRFCPVDRKTAQKCYGLARPRLFSAALCRPQNAPIPGRRKAVPPEMGAFFYGSGGLAFPSFCILPPGAAVRHGRR